MKRPIILLAIFGVLLSCQKDPDIPIVSLTVNDKVEAEWLTANLSGSAVTNTKIKTFFVQFSTDAGFGTFSEIQAQHENGQFRVSLSDLTPQTTYYYRYRAANKLGTFADNRSFSFKTKDYVAPVATSDSVTHITGKKASLYGTVTFDCGKEITERGFEVGTDANNLTKIVVDGKDFIKQLLQLSFCTQYVYRAYATSEIGTGYGELKSFKTCDVVKFGGIKVDSITINSALANYSIASNGGMPILKQGLLLWKKNSQDTTKVESSKAIRFTQLAKDQKYQLCAFAITEDSCFYSAVSEFTTKNGIITLTTAEPTDVKYTTATLGGQITDDGGAEITEYGGCWSIQVNPSTANSKQIAFGMPYSCNVTELTNNTTYYVRAYAINQYGTYYGKETTFTTKANTVPTISTSKATNISYTTATCRGEVTDDGGQSVTERGVCYSTSSNPTTSDNKKTNGDGLGSFSCNLTGLVDGTTYYVRAYATNSKGTSYGDVETFKTTTYSKPIITTNNVTNVSYTSATCGGNVTADGGQNVSERGICYATTSSPTTSNTKIKSGSGTGSFSCNITGLEESTTYYVRAYAINSKGTSYGEVKTFTTKGHTTPVLTTNSVSDITFNSAICGGSITDDGGYTITECGVCYSTTSNPTITSSKITSSSSSLGMFTCTLTSLSEATTYYVRAYATNLKGTSYGTQMIFTTSSRPVFPFSVSASTKVVFSKGNLQYQASTEKWRFAENQYDIIGEYNKNISSTNSGWIDLFGYRTSGYNNIYPFLTSTLEYDYRGNWSDINGTDYDWGQYNAISNGGNKAGLWRTPTDIEMFYLLNKRNNAAGKAIITYVNGVRGLLLLPDEWVAPEGFSKKESYSLSEWIDAEDKGAVFMPCAGYRTSKNSVCNVYGTTLSGYWLSTVWQTRNTSGYILYLPNLKFDTHDPWTGFSVRLVKDVKE